MDCKACMDKASEYIEGGLPPHEGPLVEAHLSACPSCTQVVSDVTRIVHSLRTLRRLAPSAAFDFVLRGLVRREMNRSRGQRAGLLSWVLPDRGFPLPAALLAAVLVFLVVLAADGLRHNLADRRAALETSLGAPLVSAENVTNHYVLERTTVEALRAAAAGAPAAWGTAPTTTDTTRVAAEGWQDVGVENVRLVTF